MNSKTQVPRRARKKNRRRGAYLGKEGGKCKGTGREEWPTTLRCLEKSLGNITSYHACFSKHYHPRRVFPQELYLTKNPNEKPPFRLLAI